MRLPVLTNKKDEIYDSIFVIVNQLIKIVCYKPIKVTINILNLAEIMIKVVV